MMASQTLALMFFSSLSSQVRGFQTLVMKTWSRLSAAKPVHMFTPAMMSFYHQFPSPKSFSLLHHLGISLLLESPPPSTRLSGLKKESMPIRSSFPWLFQLSSLRMMMICCVAQLLSSFKPQTISWLLQLKAQTNFVNCQPPPSQRSIWFLLRWRRQWGNNRKHKKGLRISFSKLHLMMIFWLPS